MSITYEELEIAHFQAMSVAQGLAGRVVDAFLGRKWDDLSENEHQLLIPLMSNNPLGVLVAYLALDDNGVIIRWEDSPEGIEYWKGVYERAGYDFESKTWRQDDPLPLWEKLGDIPIDENEAIEEPFLHFPRGTDRFTIWHWFEERFDITIGEMIQESE